MRCIRFTLTATLLIGLTGILHARAVKSVTGQDQGAKAQSSPTPEPTPGKHKKPGGGGGVDTLVMEGTISEDATRFVSSDDHKTWTVRNPEALKAHRGQTVKIKGSFDADTGEVHVKHVNASSMSDKK